MFLYMVSMSGWNRVWMTFLLILKAAVTRPDSGVQACEREGMVDVTLAFEDDKHGVAGRCDEVGKVVEVSDILKLSSATGQSEVMLGSNTDKKKI